jgi:hypothetical protein
VSTTLWLVTANSPEFHDLGLHEHKCEELAYEQTTTERRQPDGSGGLSETMPVTARRAVFIKTIHRRRSLRLRELFLGLRRKRNMVHEIIDRRRSGIVSALRGV